MKIKRLVNGEWVIVEVAADYTLQDGEQIVEQAVPQQAAETFTREQYDAALTAARQEEAARARVSLEREQEERRRAQETATNAQRQLDEVNRLRREAELAQMEPAQRRDAELLELRTQNQNLTLQLQATHLETYRILVISTYGAEIIPEMVVGATEAELDATGKKAHEKYKELKARFEAANPPPPALPPVVTVTPVQPQPPTAMIPPPNPAFVQPQSVTGGLPTVTNPQSLPANPGSDDVAAMTTEEAVRSGQYSGEMRARILRNVQNLGQQSVHLGSSPRHLVPTQPQTIAMPGGVIQPQGHPTGPVRPTGAVQLPPMPHQPNQPVPMPVQVHADPTQPQPAPSPDPNDPVALAQAAVERTRAGRNPVMGENRGASQALHDARVHARQTGATDPATAFQQRFSHTPPIQQ